ncbi:MAG: protein kinase domain-containing protein [Candidatus Sumerlaeaceae bacterium]
MQLKCNKCHHNWDEDLSGSAAMVQCPECYAVVPMVLASGGKSAAAGAVTKPAEEQMVFSAAETNPIWSVSGPPAALKTPPEGMDLHELPTMIDTPSGGTPTRTQAGGTAPRRLSDRFHHSATSTPTDFLFETAPVEGDTPTVTDFEDYGKTVSLPEEEVEKATAKTKSKTKSFDNASPKDVDLSGEVIAGYEVKSMLGAGGMGAVCLARQISLDRDVALKILPGRFASNPDFLVRFTREALSAAQLTHHNVIQVYDVGSDKDIHYISMEFVRGQSLADMVRRDGPLQPDDAASYVLQAARGLKYAHERGIVHRDVKPDNLMVNEHGIVKVADMGLAKMRGETEQRAPGTKLDPRLAEARGDLTLQDVAMGTPAYMAPEQARDATNVDSRADQYSLGCTLYYLLAGKPPYSGSSAMEIISKHMDAPLPRLDEAVRKVPGGLSTILERMVAKSPEERYNNLGDTIEDIEALLGVGAEKGPFAPREQHLQLLEKMQEEYYGAASARLQKACVTGFFGVVTCILVAAALLRMPYAAGTALGLLILSPAINFIVGGVLTKSYLFRRVRSVFFGMTAVGWLKTVVGTLVALGVIYALGLLPYWILAAVLSTGLVAAYQTSVVRALVNQRANPLEETRAMLKQLRLRGLSEEALQNFVCRFSGAHWEEMFEDLFGYESMVLARGKWATTDHLTARNRFATWRDPIARWLHTIEEDRKAIREKRQLVKVEARRLKSQGISEAEANEKAKRLAAKAHADIKVAGKIDASIASPIRARKIEKHIWDLTLQFVRLALGGAVVVIFIAWFLQARVPGLGQVNTQIARLPIPQPIRAAIFTWYGAAAGLALFMSGFSWRRIATTLIFTGAVLVLAGGYILPLVAGRMEMLTSVRYYMASLGIAAFGLLICISAKVSGHRF